MSLEDDGIELSSPLYERIIDEGLQHLHDEDFKAEQYFSRHTDPLISALVFDLCVDREPLSKMHADVPEEQRFDDTVLSLVNNIKLHYVQMELKAMLSQAKNPELMKDKEASNELLSRFAQRSKYAKELADACGQQVVLN